MMQEEILQALMTVIDPELMVDIVNLGLIYGIDVNDDVCTVTMTLTIPGCPLSDVIKRNITEAVTKVAGINEVKIELVWYPVWGLDKMSDQAKKSLDIPMEVTNENN